MEIEVNNKQLFWFSDLIVSKLNRNEISILIKLLQKEKRKIYLIEYTNQKKKYKK